MPATINPVSTRENVHAVVLKPGGKARRKAVREAKIAVSVDRRKRRRPRLDARSMTRKFDRD